MRLKQKCSWNINLMLLLILCFLNCVVLCNVSYLSVVAIFSRAAKTSSLLLLARDTESSSPRAKEERKLRTNCNEFCKHGTLTPSIIIAPPAGHSPQHITHAGPPHPLYSILAHGPYFIKMDFWSSNANHSMLLPWSNSSIQGTSHIMPRLKISTSAVRLTVSAIHLGLHATALPDQEREGGVLLLEPHVILLYEVPTFEERSEDRIEPAGT